MNQQKSPEIIKIIEEFREYLKTEEGKYHLSYLKEKEPKETKEVLLKLQNMKKGSPEFVELVLYGLLPNSETKYAKRISIAPAFLNIKKFFARFGYSEDDWAELANLIFDLVDKFYKQPDKLESLIREFISHRLSKAIQCGSLSPIFFALNSEFPIVNNREIRTYRSLYFLIFNQVDELSQRLEDYLSNVEKIKNLTKKLADDYGFKEITDMAIFDLFCYWYDETVLKSEENDTAKPRIIRKTSQEKVSTPIEERDVTKFLQILACSPPQPFLVETLQKLDEEGKIIYNTEFQRGEVWDISRKQKLIDSILRGYNINTIFLRQLNDGKYECLDGQQRLKTILREFLKDKFPINPKFTPEFKRETYFSDLPDSLKSKIKSYIIYAIIFYTVDDEETCKIFLRLQEGLRLNSAEKLNAMMGFLRNEIVELSKHSFLKKLGIKDYRFSHRYILAQVYLLTLRNQIVDTKFRNLQEMYTTYRTTRPPETVTNTVKKVLNFLDKQFGEDAKVVKFNADFISLYLLGKHIIENYVTSENDNTRLKEFFINFAIKVGEIESSEKEEDIPYFEYKTYRKTSADSKNSIEKRFNILLSKFLEFNPTLLPKDPNRNFNYWEKLAIYYRDKGICQLKISEKCKGKTSFDEGVADHKIPHSKGGKTTVENGQWSCIPCNLKKLNKVEQNDRKSR
jgi:hypothetical protein